MKPLITIWYKPSETFDYLLEKKTQNNSIFFIFYLIGIIAGIPSVLKSDFIKLVGPIGIFFLIIVAGVIGGLFLQYVWVFIFWIFGQILQGKATNKEIRIVFAYSIIPILFKSILLIFQFLNYRHDEMQYENIGLYNNLTNFLLLVIFLRFFVIGMSKVQKFSYLYALLNFLIPTTIIGFIILMSRY